jgi:VRR-NUC domain
MSAQRYRPAPVPDRNGEARIQAAIVEWIRTVAPNVLVFHVPNGGFRSKVEAARLKWTGVVAGVPDLAIIAPGGRAHFLEIKTTSGRLSEDQRDVIGALAKLGSPVMTVTSVDDARRAFAGWGISTREASL